MAITGNVEMRDLTPPMTPPTWLTDRQLEDLRSQILRQPNRTLLESNEEIQKLIFKAQVDLNEVTGEADPVVRLIDFQHPERNTFHTRPRVWILAPSLKSCVWCVESA